MKKAIVLDFSSGTVHIIHLDDNNENDITERVENIMTEFRISNYEFMIVQTEYLGNIPINEIYE